MTWYLRGFDTDTDRLTEEIDLDAALRDIFRRMWGCADDDPMYDSAPLVGPLFDRIREMFQVTLDPSKAWFLEYQGEGWKD